MPKGIEHRLSTNSSNKDIFERSKQEDEKALKNGGYGVKLAYKNSRGGTNTQKGRNRPRKILWFNPPYNMEVVNNLGKEFFKLLKRYFSDTNPLHKIFNKNSIKRSYSCIPNINSIINKSNTTKLNKEKIRRLLNVIVDIRLCVHLKANVNSNVWYIKWRCILIRVVIKIRTYILGQRNGNLKLGTITIDRVSPTKNIDVVPRYLIMCGRLKIKKE